MDDSPAGDATIASFRLYAFYRFQVLLMFVIFLFVGLSVAGAEITVRSGQLGAFTVIWLAVMAWNGYWILFRISYRIELTEHELRWKAPLRSGQIPLNAVRAMRPQPLGSAIEVIEVDGGRNVLIFARRGIFEFAEELVRLSPAVQVRFGWQVRMNRRWGPSGFRQGR